MSNTLKVQPFGVLLQWIRTELATSQSIFGLPRSLFYTPSSASPMASEMFGHTLATPIGPAAGPHTQLAQNIVCAWLSGGRFIELKTVQIMDELDIPRPCIDMADEGYNVEWSQELKLEQSGAEYVKAWVLVHVLHRLLGFDEAPVGTVFNMSVGYNLDGIQSAAMTRFMDRLADASAEIEELRPILHAQLPGLAGVPIPPRLTNSVTLSTMHGCPPDEVEKIARYLLEERGLHTLIKLNPTLLGRDTVRHILNDELDYDDVHVPDSAFDHDLRYERAVELIAALRAVAARRGLTFGVKLSNTLATANHRGVLPGDEMYLSGRALYPVTLTLFHKLAQEFGGSLNVSYSGGADALNVTELLAAGARPVTAASDLLKPGGYSRLLQYLENVEAELQRRGASSLDELAADRLATLEHAAQGARSAARYKRAYHPYGLPKVESALGALDCIAAPCRTRCAVCQDVPEYAWRIAHGGVDQALEVILSRNPLPGITGYVCTQLCQTACTRNNYDEPISIRALKRFAVEHASAAGPHPPSPIPTAASPRVAIVGAGPSGLSAAYFLALNGVRVTVYEARDVPGGMPAIAPAFRLPPEVVQADVERIRRLGVEIELSRPIVTPPETLLAAGFDAVYLACGWQQDARLGIAGEEGEGVLHALELLERVARGERPALGSRVLVIGGGNTAMDAARTAQRLTGRPVTVVYRRTRAEMPAGREEIEDLLAEGNTILELTSPLQILLRDGRVAALRCVRNELGEADAGGRRRPVPLAGSEFEIEAGTVIAAIGQQPELALVRGSAVSQRPGGAIAIDLKSGHAAPGPIYAGGDVVRGPATIVAACADGRRAAETICRELGIDPSAPHPAEGGLTAAQVLQVKRARARREPAHKPATLSAAQRGGSEVVEQPLSDEAARAEAGRCLQCAAVCDKCVEVCPNRANHVYRVSPLHLSVPRLACRDGRLLPAGEELFQVTQDRQIVHVDDFCNECGNCATFCVQQGKPYQDKPRLFLQKSDFLQESNNAYYVGPGQIAARQAGLEARLHVNEDEMTYETPLLRVTLAYDTTGTREGLRIVSLALKEAFDGEVSLVQAAQMAVILNGVTSSLPFLVME